MYFLLSGEGPTDMGVGTNVAAICEGNEYLCGPMAIVVDQIAQRHQGHQYSPLELNLCGFVSEHHIAARARTELKPAKKSLRLPGIKQPKETRYFFNNARMLARIAKEKQTDRDEDVAAILFRDCDGTASAGRGLWHEKYDSMMHGFEEERFAKGVPMLPKPKSEAWLIAGITGKSTHDGTPLEDWSGNDKSPRSLKPALEELIAQRPSREVLCRLVREGGVDYERIGLPKFERFRVRLCTVLD
jgi:hypothetical protein